MNASYYKCCAVPMCKSTSNSTPQKLFINVPRSAQIRRQWLALARRNPASLTPTSTSHFCEDHFDLPNDMENYAQYTTMGKVSRIMMRPGCLPSKFACQATRAGTSGVGRRASKRLRRILIKECKKKIKTDSLQQSEKLSIEVPSQNEDPPKQQEESSLKAIKKNATYYKCCAVPMCKSTSNTTPQKLFIHVPKNEQIRRKWLTLARRNPGSLTPTSTSHFCEDHFDLPNDMENYAQYTTMGKVSRIMMRPGCLPSKFACHATRPGTSIGVGRRASKRLKRILTTKCEEDIKTDSLQQSEKLSIEISSQDEDPLLQQQENISISDKGAEIHVTAKHRSKTTQIVSNSRRKQNSPKKFSETSVSSSPIKVSKLERYNKPHQFLSSVTCSDDQSGSDLSLYLLQRSVTL